MGGQRGEASGIQTNSLSLAHGELCSPVAHQSGPQVRLPQPSVAGFGLPWEGVALAQGLSVVESDPAEGAGWSVTVPAMGDGDVT